MWTWPEAQVCNSRNASLMSGATFAAEPCSQKATEKRQTAGRTGQAVVTVQQSATVTHQHWIVLVHL